MATANSKGRWILYPHLALVDRCITALVKRWIPERIVLVQLPPRHGKSQLCSHWLPAWYLREYPDRQVQLATYADDFASDWGLRAQRTFHDVSTCWNLRLITMQMPAEQRKLDNNRRRIRDWGIAGRLGGMRTAGARGPLTGRGADLLVMDDLIKNDEQAMSEAYRIKLWDWFQSTAWTRLEPDGVCVAIGTRWHEDDPLGRLLRWHLDGGERVRHVRLPALSEETDLLGRQPGEALWPQRWNREKLEKIRDGLDAYWWNALYQARPSVHGRAMWPADYWQDITTDWMPGAYHLSCLALDLAQGKAKGDYAATVFAGTSNDRIWVEADVTRRPPEDQVRVAVDMYLEHVPDVVVVEEEGFQNLALALFRHELSRRGIGPIPVRGLGTGGVAKTSRIARLGSYFHQRSIKIRGTPGGHRLVQQCREFPVADHDDGPDALELAIRGMGLKIRSERGAERYGSLFPV